MELTQLSKTTSVAGCLLVCGEPLLVVEPPIGAEDVTDYVPVYLLWATRFGAAPLVVKEVRED